MKAIEIRADWAAQTNYKHTRDIEPNRAQLASKVWRHPVVHLTDRTIQEVGPTEVLIRVRACGLCGSDVAMASTDKDGYVRYPHMMSSPIIPGHEFSGQIESMGADVKRYWPALEIQEPVCAEAVVNCGFCHFCKQGKFDFCEYSEERGFTLNGAMAEYCIADIRHTWSLAQLTRLFSDTELFVVGSLIEPHAGVFKAITDAKFVPGSNVLIIGAGPIGLAAISVFRALGAGNIFVAEPSYKRRAIADKLITVGKIFDPFAFDLSKVILEYTHNAGVAYIFEAAGVAEKNWPAITRLLHSSSPGATVIFFGQSKEEVPVSPQLFVQRFVKFTGLHGHSKVWPQVINLFAARAINPLKIVTKRIGLQEVPEWLARLETDKSEGKVTICF